MAYPPWLFRPDAGSMLRRMSPANAPASNSQGADNRISRKGSTRPTSPPRLLPVSLCRSSLNLSCYSIARFIGRSLPLVSGRLCTGGPFPSEGRSQNSQMAGRMKSGSEGSHPKKSIDVVNQQSPALRGRAAAALACICLTAALVSCSSPRSSRQPKTLAELDTSGKSPQELAGFVFEHYGCKSCHTLGRAGKFGFTERGKEVGKNFEGCVSLLTAMNIIGHVPEENRTAGEKRKAAHFREFGCSACHQVTPGRMGLTEVGSKLAFLHMACTDVQRVLSQR